jgi:hypothetical protein
MAQARSTLAVSPAVFQADVPGIVDFDERVWWM